MTPTSFDKIQRSIRACTACVDHGYISSASPILFGTPAARIMILGQAPGPTATERPLPYSGASGKTLQQWLGRAGFEDGAIHDPDRFYLTSITKCFPGRAISGKGDREPRKAEIELCSRHLDNELQWVRPEVILALGRLSIGTLVHSARNRPLATIVGNAYSVEYRAAKGATVLPLPHPSGVSRWPNSTSNRQLLEQALAWLDRSRRERGL